MNGEELKTIFLEDPNDLRLNDPEVARELLSYQFCGEDSDPDDDEVVLAYVLNVLIQNQKLSIKESTEVIQRHIDAHNTLHEINDREPLILYRLGTTMVQVIEHAIGYETNEEIIETPVAYRKKVKRTIFRITKKVGITAAAAAMFSILVLPAPGNKQNAHNKNIISYIVNEIQEFVQYRNHSDSSEREPIRNLSWMEEGFTATDNSKLSIDAGIAASMIQTEYVRGEETIILEVTIHENDFANYVETDGNNILEVVIDDHVYNYTLNGGIHQFMWNIQNHSYVLVGYNTDVDVLKNIIKNNFGG